MPGGRQGAAGFVAARLRAAREAAHLTQGALAEAAGAHVKEVREWESGRRVPQVEAVAALARALHIRPLDLLDRDADQALTLQDLRAAAGLSQESAAELAGLQRATYAKIERGATVTISDDNATGIGRALDVNADEVRAAHAASRAVHLERQNGRSGRGRDRLGED